MSLLIDCCCDEKTATPCTGFNAGEKTYCRIGFTMALGYSGTYSKNSQGGDFDSGCSQTLKNGLDISITSSESYSLSASFVFSFKVDGTTGSPAYVTSLGGGTPSDIAIQSTSYSLTGSASHARTRINYDSFAQCSSKFVDSHTGSMTGTGIDTSSMTLGGFSPDVYFIEESGETLGGCMLDKCRIRMLVNDVRLNYSLTGSGSIIEYGGQGCDDEEDETTVSPGSSTQTSLMGVTLHTAGGNSDCTDQVSTFPSLQIDAGHFRTTRLFSPLSLTSNGTFTLGDTSAAALTGCDYQTHMDGGSWVKTYRTSESLDSYETCPGPAPRWVEGDEELVQTFTASAGVTSVTFTDSTP